MKILKMITVVMLTVFISFAAIAMEELSFDFEDGIDGWQIPGWAFDDPDYAGKSLEVSSDIASKGERSLRLISDFPGGEWKASIIEYPIELDMRGYKRISMDVYLPEAADTKLINARIVITAGGPWFFIETREVYYLKPGKWTTVEAKINVSERGQLAEWKCNTEEECIVANLDDVKRVSLRIEYNANDWQGGKPYNGPIYIDNVVIK